MKVLILVLIVGFVVYYIIKRNNTQRNATNRAKIESSNPIDGINKSEQHVYSRDEEDMADTVERKIAKKLNIPDNQVNDFLHNIEKKQKSLNLAPDISKLNREDNQLFNLAKEGVGMLDHMIAGSESYLNLSDQGKAEALILCSTIVIQLHSHFKNELDLDTLTDRYFLLLFDNTLSFDVKDRIEFLNKRIDFYNEQVYAALSLSSSLEKCNIDNALACLFNALYLHPGNENPTLVNRDEIKKISLIMFNTVLHKVVKHLQDGKNRLRDNTDPQKAEYRENVLKLFNALVPDSKRAMVNDSLAWILSTQFISMIKEECLNPDFTLPYDIKAKFNSVIALRRNLKLSDLEVNNILEDVQNEFVNSFNGQHFSSF